MLSSQFTPIDYLTIGHLACDRTPQGCQLGGTAAYASLTAQAAGQRAGIITAIGQDVSLTSIHDLPLAGVLVPKSTTFENKVTKTGRAQTLHHHARVLTIDLLPEIWRSPAVVHLGPIAHELDESWFQCFHDTFLGVTPQGWFRQWDANGRVAVQEWPQAVNLLPLADAVVISIEDVARDEGKIQELANVCPIFVVTEGAGGARLFVRGQATRIAPYSVQEVDATGAGDIFAAVFFTHLHISGNPLIAAQTASRLAACSVTRRGLAGIPTHEEIQTYWELIEHDTYLYAG